MLKTIKVEELNETNNKLILSVNDNEIELSLNREEVLPVIDWFDSVCSYFPASDVSQFAMIINRQYIDTYGLESNLIVVDVYE